MKKVRKTPRCSRVLSCCFCERESASRCVLCGHAVCKLHVSALAHECSQEESVHDHEERSRL